MLYFTTSLIKNANIVTRTPVFHRKPSALWCDLLFQPSLLTLHTVTPTHHTSVLKHQPPQQHCTEGDSTLLRTWGVFGAGRDPWLTIACLNLLRAHITRVGHWPKEPLPWQAQHTRKKATKRAGRLCRSSGRGRLSKIMRLSKLPIPTQAGESSEIRDTADCLLTCEETFKSVIPLLALSWSIACCGFCHEFCYIWEPCLFLLHPATTI